MTWPLMILAFFAVILGLFGTPWANQFHHLIGEAFEATPFDLFVAGLSTVLALGGVVLGWLVYGRKPLAAGQVDPLKRWLGPVHTVLENKYYVDELYHLIFIRPAIWLAYTSFKFDNRWVIDPIVNLAGRVGVALSNFSSFLDNRYVDGAVHLVWRVAVVLSGWNRLFDINVVNGAVDLAGRLTQIGGERLRPIQTGRVQNYLVVALVTVLMLLGLYLVYWL